MFEQMMTQNLYGNKTLIPLFGKKTCTLEPVIVSVGRLMLFLPLSDMALNIEDLLANIPEREQDAERKQVKC